MAIGAAVSAVFGGGGLNLVNGMPAASTGTDVIGSTHTPTPPGIAFAPNDIPDHEGTVITGSKTVLMSGPRQDGHRLRRPLGEEHLSMAG
jgi:hypothetical protein